MHCLHDKPNGIVINHDGDWSDEARIAWYLASEYPEHPGPTPPSLRECRCSGRDLVAGKFTLLTGDEPPVNVLTRAVALAVETYLRFKLERFLDVDLFVKRGKL